MFQRFAALGDPTRFAIVERLLAEGELTAGALQQGQNISGPAVSRHLKVLRNAGVVEQRVDAQRRIYMVRKECVSEIHEWTLSHQEFWTQSLDRLDAAITEAMEEK